MSQVSTATERFEALGSLYFRATGYLRPGQSEPLETGRDSNDSQNRERFEQWLATRSIVDALSEIIRLRRRVEVLESEGGCVVCESRLRLEESFGNKS